NSPGYEVGDGLPSGVDFHEGSATTRTATDDTGTRTIHWNGSITSGGNVTITVDGRVSEGASGTITDQATATLDLDNTGTNETAVMTDDPAAGGPNDATSFTAAAAATAAVPTLSPM